MVPGDCLQERETRRFRRAPDRCHKYAPKHHVWRHTQALFAIVW